MLKTSLLTIDLRLGSSLIANLHLLKALFILHQIVLPQIPSFLPKMFYAWLFHWDVARVLFGVLATLLAVCSVLVFFGISGGGEKSFLMLPWFGAVAIFLVFSVASAVYTAVRAEAYSILLYGLVSIVVEVYCMLVVASYYMEIRE